MSDQLSIQEPRPRPVPRQSEPIPVELEQATLEQVARAIFTTAKKPDPSRHRRVMTG